MTDNGKVRQFQDGKSGPDLTNDDALDFIARHKDQPWLLYSHSEPE